MKTFEQCPLKFKFKYIEKIESNIEQSIEAFLGSNVHKTLEKLYRDLKFQKLNSLEKLLKYFNLEWEKNWNTGIIIVRDYKPENYRKMGEQFIRDYYNKHKPFNEGKIIGLEQKINLKLDPKGRYKLQGFIDRLMTTGDGKYEIHDYKTNANLPYEEYMKEDRQLALYALAVLNAYQDAKDIKLIWHFLASDKKIIIEKTEEELENLKKETIKLIDKINSTKDFKPKKSKLCDWCEFRSSCPEWSHVYKTENLSPKEFSKEDGVKLVNKYVELQEEKKKHCNRIDKELDQVKEAIIKLCEKEGFTTLNGSDHLARIWIKDVFKFPGKNDEKRIILEKIIKDSGLWNDLSQLDTFQLSRFLDEKQFSPMLSSIIMEFARKERIERIYLKKKDEN